MRRITEGKRSQQTVPTAACPLHARAGRRCNIDAKVRLVQASRRGCERCSGGDALERFRLALPVHSSGSDELSGTVVARMSCSRSAMKNLLLENRLGGGVDRVLARGCGSRGGQQAGRCVGSGDRYAEQPGASLDRRRPASGTPASRPLPSAAGAVAAVPSSASGSDPRARVTRGHASGRHGAAADAADVGRIGHQQRRGPGARDAATRRQSTASRRCPRGRPCIGHVTDAQRSAKVKGRATVAFRFTRVDLPGEGEHDQHPHRHGVAHWRRRRRRRMPPRSAAPRSAARSSAASSAAATAPPRAPPSAAPAAPASCSRRAARKSRSPLARRSRVKLTAPLTVRVRAS